MYTFFFYRNSSSSGWHVCACVCSTRVPSKPILSKPTKPTKPTLTNLHMYARKLTKPVNVWACHAFFLSSSLTYTRVYVYMFLCGYVCGYTMMQGKRSTLPGEKNQVWWWRGWMRGLKLEHESGSKAVGEGGKKRVQGTCSHYKRKNRIESSWTVATSCIRICKSCSDTNFKSLCCVGRCACSPLSAIEAHRLDSNKKQTQTRETAWRERARRKRGMERKERPRRYISPGAIDWGTVRAFWMLRLEALYSCCKVSKGRGQVPRVELQAFFFIISWVYAGPVLVLILVSVGNRWGLELVFKVSWLQPTSQSSCLQTITWRLNHDIIITRTA